MANQDIRPEAADRRPPGRPTDFNPDTADTIIRLVRQGNFVETAAAFAGVTARTVRNWIARGKRRGEPEFAEFRRRLLQAKAEAEINDLDRLSKDPSWMATAWRLERRNPKRWARPPIRVESPPKPNPPRPIRQVVKEIREVLAGMRHRDHVAGE